MNEFGMGNRPLASKRFEIWMVEPDRYHTPMKRPYNNNLDMRRKLAIPDNTYLHAKRWLEQRDDLLRRVFFICEE